MKLNVLSFDIGVKNFAWCLDHYEDLNLCDTEEEFVKSGTVVLLDNVCLAEDGRKTPGPEIFCKVSGFLEEITGGNQVDVVLVEKQIPRNTNAVRIAQHVWTWFHAKHPGTRLEFYPAKYKTSVFGQKLQTYKDRKGFAVHKAKEILGGRGDLVHLQKLQGKKPDDMADCVLMCLSFVIREYA